MDNQTTAQESCWVNTFVFISGFLLGAGAALLMAPEPGSTLRGRLAKGARTAQDELADIAADTKGTVTTLSREAKQAMKQTASRFTAAVDATKQSVTATPDESPSQ